MKPSSYLISTRLINYIKSTIFTAMTRSMLCSSLPKKTSAIDKILIEINSAQLKISILSDKMLAHWVKVHPKRDPIS